VPEIDAGELLLRPVRREVAAALRALLAHLLATGGCAGWSPRPWRSTRPVAG
jgi:hypothetical protein